MRLHGKVPQKAMATLAMGLAHFLARTLRFRFVIDDLAAVPHLAPGPVIYAFWHEMLLIPMLTHGGAAVPLLSLSRDGKVLETVLQRYGGGLIRGSSDHGRIGHGGRKALQEMLRIGREHHVAIALDGPLGPPRRVAVGKRRSASAGAILLASRNGMPLVPLGMAPGAAHRVGPAGRIIAIPLPSLPVWCVCGSPLHLPPALSREGREESVRRLQAAMDDAQGRAERYAAGSRPSGPVLNLRDVRRLRPDDPLKV